MEFRATYYDGETSQPHAVVVRTTASGSLRIEGLEEPREFELGEVRLSPRLGNTVRSLNLPGGAKCETDDHTAVDALIHARDGGRRAWLHQLESKWHFALGALAFIALVVVVGLKWGIPVAARYVAMNVPDEMAYDLGRGTLATLDQTLFAKSELSPERRGELEAAFERLAAQFPDLPLELHFRKAGMPNAFALPDGSVVVTDELVALSTSSEQILSVLAHEIGHVHHRHTLRMALESSTVALLAAVTIGDASQFVALLSALPAMYTNAQYSRDHETEADSFALEHMDRSGIPRRHFAEILRALQKASGVEDKGVLTYISSHPPTEERVRRFLGAGGETSR